MGGCREKVRGCFSWEQMGHFGRYCPRESVSICFRYNQVGYKKAYYSELIRGAVRAPAPATLRSIDGREGIVDNPRVRSRSLKLQAEGDPSSTS